MKKELEIRIHARAGQGSKTMAQFIAEAAAKKGKYVQAFPYFGPARGGAPMDAFVRISDRPIYKHAQVKEPDILVVIDETLIIANNICLPLKHSQILLLNTNKKIEEVKIKYKTTAQINVINADKIALGYFKKTIVNTVMLGAATRILDDVDLADVISVVKGKFMEKFGKELTDLNLKAIREGYKLLKNE